MSETLTTNMKALRKKKKKKRNAFPLKFETTITEAERQSEKKGDGSN